MVIHVRRAGYLPPWGWQLCRVMGGSFRVKWVAALPCNRWQLCCEIRKLPSETEIQGLLSSGLRRLQDAINAELSLESRFDLAYNAAHAFALAALRFHGYRSESRYLVFQCLQHTIALPTEQWRILDQAHRKRNLAEYEGDMDVDEQLVAALQRVA